MTKGVVNECKSSSIDYLTFHSFALFWGGVSYCKELKEKIKFKRVKKKTRVKRQNKIRRECGRFKTTIKVH